MVLSRLDPSQLIWPMLAAVLSPLVAHLVALLRPHLPARVPLLLSAPASSLSLLSSWALLFSFPPSSVDFLSCKISRLSKAILPHVLAMYENTG
jgi:hypothetical protein